VLVTVVRTVEVVQANDCLTVFAHNFLDADWNRLAATSR
jgi:hypothetical protein